MMCQWKALMDILPPKMRQETEKLGKETLQELRLRLGMQPQLILAGESRFLNQKTTREDMTFLINTASRYSPWAAATIAQGYITAPGGHRIGLCGDAICRNGSFEGIRETTSLCIRVARDYPGIAREVKAQDGSILILGPPGSGKTTLLRDLARQLAEWEMVSVVDERGELYPQGFARGKCMDVLTGCPKPAGIDMVLRTMGPACIAVDEITAEEDCQAMIQAAHCGVRMLATAHGASLRDLRRRPLYSRLLESGIFETALVLRRNKSFSVERMGL